MNPFKKSGWLAVLLFTLPAFFVPAASGVALQEQVFETTLPNGLKVILLENHKAPLLTFQIWYRVGSRNEMWGKTGLSHVLEHMMFKGTPKVGPEEFSRIVQDNGGNLNAFTSRDYTTYFENLSSDRVQVVIELEADRLQNLVLREDDFHTERMVVMEERRLRTDDDPGAVLVEQLEATAFQVQPYHWPIIGWMQDLEKLTLEDLKAYYQTYYSPSNAFLVVVGDFNREDLLSKIEKAFGSIPKGVAPSQERGKESPQLGERRVIVKKEAQLPSLVMGYHVPNLEQPDSYVLEVTAALLSGGKTSRLYQSLVRDRQLVLNVDADHSLLTKDSSLFYLWADPLPGKEVADVEKALDQEVERLQRDLIDERELEKVKNQLESSFIFAQDSLFYQAMLLARYEIVSTWKGADGYIPSIRSVTAADIQRVASKYLIPENRTVAILIPLPPKEGKTLPSGPSTREGVIH